MNKMEMLIRERQLEQAKERHVKEGMRIIDEEIFLKSENIKENLSSASNSTKS